MLAALLEAALAAVYLEHGFERVEPAIVQAFELAAREHFEKGRQPDGSFLDEREYLLVTGARR